MSESTTSWSVRALKAFGQFWWDFLIGDTPELFVSTLVLLAVVAVVSLNAGANTLAVVLSPTLVVLSLFATLWRVRRSR